MYRSTGNGKRRRPFTKEYEEALIACTQVLPAAIKAQVETAKIFYEGIKQWKNGKTGKLRIYNQLDSMLNILEEDMKQLLIR